MYRLKNLKTNKIDEAVPAVDKTLALKYNQILNDIGEQLLWVDE